MRRWLSIRPCATSTGAPSAVVGGSFGEITTLTAAGILTIRDGTRAAHGLLAGAQTLDAAVAVVNDDQSVVIAGSLPALTCVEKAAAGVGVTAVRPHLPLTSHHPSLAAEAAVFAEAVRAYHRAEPLCPVCRRGRTRLRGDRRPGSAARRLPGPAAPLHQVVTAHGPDVLFEAGTGSALASSARRVPSDIAVPAVHAPLAEPGFSW
ncbi:hypothetical protein ABT063_43420 [Streptomyces sp. NPDC002838]|uniref:hypothetical protein n=1 Tax=Streptomyces sp. NPDC002838 TaxID=3154436 RepID=UPI003330CFDC